MYLVEIFTMNDFNKIVLLLNKNIMKNYFEQNYQNKLKIKMNK